MFNNQRLLITYVGKREMIGGEKISGIQSLFSKHLGYFIWLFRIKEMFVCYRSINSAANRSFEKNNEFVIAEYGMYQRTASDAQ